MPPSSYERRLLVVAMLGDRASQVCALDADSGLKVGEVAGVVRNGIWPRLEPDARILAPPDNSLFDGAVEDAGLDQGMSGQRARHAADRVQLRRQQHGAAIRFLLGLPCLGIFRAPAIILVGANDVVRIKIVLTQE